MTVHNLAYQGLFPAGLLQALRLPDRAFQVEGVEYYGSIGFLKAGLQFADRITTVSPTYAREIQTPEFGFGLDGLLRARGSVVSGIRNGIDIAIWNPLRDPLIQARYGRSKLQGREKNASELRARMGLENKTEALLFGIVSRLVPQKGLDIVADAAAAFLDRGAQLAVLGSGDASLEQRFAALAAAHPGRIACVLGYDEALAHLIQAGADAILIPSRFEPCGLTQLCALRYGAIPVGARVGGLADTIIDPEDAAPEKVNGFLFHPVTREALEGVLERVTRVWSDRKAWRGLQINGMRTDVSWNGPAGEYANLYAGLMMNKM
jgi:starch synthase